VIVKKISFLPPSRASGFTTREKKSGDFFPYIMPLWWWSWLISQERNQWAFYTHGEGEETC